MNEMDTLTRVAFILTIPGQPRIFMVTMNDIDTLTMAAFILTIPGQPRIIMGYSDRHGYSDKGCFHIDDNHGWSRVVTGMIWL